MERIEVLNVPVNVTTTEEINENIKEVIENKKQFTILSINLNKIIQFHENKEFAAIVDSFECFIPDGISIVKASDKLNDRITGVDLFEDICKNHEKLNAKIFLYGSAQEVVEKAKEVLEEKYTGINIVGYENGFVKDTDVLINKINESGANILFIAMGSPKQEFWIHENRNKLNVNVLMGVGGTFDVMSGKIKRAPLVFRKLGLEWLYRMLREPVKRFKQIPLQMKYWIKLKKNKG